MKKRLSSLVFLLIINCLFWPSISNARIETMMVRGGDSIWKISKRYGVPMSSIFRMIPNDKTKKLVCKVIGKNSDTIHVGEILGIRLPGKNTAAEETSKIRSMISHRVKQGENLESIQARWKSTEVFFENGDRVTSTNKLAIGERLYIKNSPPNNLSKYVSTLVKRGEGPTYVAQRLTGDYKNHKYLFKKVKGSFKRLPQNFIPHPGDRLYMPRNLCLPIFNKHKTMDPIAPPSNEKPFEKRTRPLNLAIKVDNSIPISVIETTPTPEPEVELSFTRSSNIRPVIVPITTSRTKSLAFSEKMNILEKELAKLEESPKKPKTYEVKRPARNLLSKKRETSPRKKARLVSNKSREGVEFEYHKPKWGPGSKSWNWSKKQMRDEIRRVFGPKHSRIMIAVAHGESSYRPRLIGRLNNGKDVGLFQINVLVHKQYSSPKEVEKLKDPGYNILVAKKIFDARVKRTGKYYVDWMAYTNGSYKNYLYLAES